MGLYPDHAKSIQPMSECLYLQLLTTLTCLLVYNDVFTEGYQVGFQAYPIPHLSTLVV